MLDDLVKLLISSSKAKTNSRVRAKNRRINKVRGKLATSLRPRLSITRSAKHIYAQLFKPKLDEQGVVQTPEVLAAAGSVQKDLREQVAGKDKKGVSALVGAKIARLAKELGVSKVVFDRSGNLYHGRVKALADAARAEGLEF